ncbi:PfkB family carbohydrate kinase [Lentzea sp. NPDC051208]|uniref:PfkB family carbohydrate kinase n=1 Tax=Lentzea sp. NPDC051208 TaxID=3154642 RepID=UPI003441304E
MIDLLTFGETMAAFRADQPLRLGGNLRLSIAGAEATVAIGAARLGHRARYVGRVGPDEFGLLITRTLKAEGVDIRQVSRCAAPTGFIVFEPRIADVVRVTYRRTGSAGSTMDAPDLERALADGARVLHATGITAALGEGPLRAVRAAVTNASDAGSVPSAST